jgi:hypothetical protein
MQGPPESRCQTARPTKTIMNHSGERRMAPVRRFACCVAICAASLTATGVSADDAAVEQRLNDVYTQLRRTLTPAEKEALKQEELRWLNERERVSRGDPRRTELTEERIPISFSPLTPVFLGAARSEPPPPPPTRSTPKSPP